MVIGLVLSLIFSLVIGSALTGLYLQSKWRKEIEDAKQELAAFAEMHKEQEATMKELRQKVADLEYQLGAAQKDLNYERSKNASE